MFKSQETPENFSLTKKNEESLRPQKEFDLTTFEGWVARMYFTYFPEIPEDQIQDHFKNVLPDYMQAQTKRFWELALQVRDTLGGEKGDEFLKNSPP